MRGEREERERTWRGVVVYRLQGGDKRRGKCYSFSAKGPRAAGTKKKNAQLQPTPNRCPVDKFRKAGCLTKLACLPPRSLAEMKHPLFYSFIHDQTSRVVPSICTCMFQKHTYTSFPAKFIHPSIHPSIHSLFIIHSNTLSPTHHQRVGRHIFFSFLISQVIPG